MQTKFDPKQTCIIIDFDKTITQGYVNGVSFPGITLILRDKDFLSVEYSIDANSLAKKYKPIEEDYSLPLETRYKAAESWWLEHFDLLIKSKLNLQHISQASKSKQIVIRTGFLELASYTFKNNIPVIIFSAAGIGSEAIEFILKRENLFTDNITIISNQFNWDENGNAVSVVMPIIHSLNKTGISLRNAKAWGKIKDKKYAIVVGDALHDLQMSEGIDFEKVISFGVLNEVTPENLALYQKSFTHVIRDGESLDQVLQIFA